MLGEGPCQGVPDGRVRGQDPIGHVQAARHYAERYRNLHQFYEAVFSALAERGELTSPIEPAALATMTIALINGLQQQWLFDRDSVNVEGAIRTFLLSIIPGLAA
ncbi:TetR family transcriptional regulator C-terminal domain-containing protein [Streptomyces sp. NPDC050392]|uniref:TetR family transcriptional regulator C-terminal domain-containing protein n=1 Tax=Streptomyces sp. NPDC050392 TaxID=3155782 RepID=UPI003437CBF0